MSITGHRKEQIRIELLTRQENSLGYLDGFSSGSLSWNANADLPAGGSIVLEDRGQDINFSQDRIRVWWEVDGLESWALGVYVIAAPGTHFRADGTDRNISLIDKMTVVRDDVLLTTLQIPAGTNAVQAAVQQIRATGETRIAATPSSAVLSNDMSWEPGTSRQRVINDLLVSVAGYWALWTDRNGLFRVEPYINPADRPIVYRFVESDTSIHSPEWEYELALWEATNTVVLVSQADEDDNTLTAYAVDDNPASPTSTVSMGRVLNAIVKENVETSSQADLQRQATRKLLDNSNVVGKVSVSHRPISVWYNEAVEFKSQGMDTKATITKMKLNLSAGSLVQAEWRQA